MDASLTPPPAPSPTKKARRTFSLRAKLLVGFTLAFSVVFAAAFYWFYQFSTGVALERIRQDLVDTVTGAARNIDGDALTELSRAGKPNGAGFSDHPLYDREMTEFARINEIEPRAWPYTYVKGGQDNEIIWMTDLWSTKDAGRAVRFSEFFTSKGKLWKGLSGLEINMPRDKRGLGEENPLWGRVGLGEFNALGRVGYTDEWGSWVSAYHPVRNRAGEIVGAVGIDFLASDVDAVQNAIMRQVLGVFALVYAALFVLVFLISGVLTRPIGHLTAAARKIGEGDYDQDLGALTRARARDEIVALAEVFQGMVAKVREREQSLRREVQELRIEIDQGKKERQVQEIVDSDFFRDLKSKAQGMRGRAREQSAAPAEGAPTDAPPADAPSA